MPEHTQRLVAVLYEHPLLGEGIARILRRETEAEVTAVSTGDVRAMEAVLARQPNVVIFEGSQCGPYCRRLAPHAELIDVTSAMSPKVSATTASVWRIIRAVVVAKIGSPVPQQVVG